MTLSDALEAAREAADRSARRAPFVEFLRNPHAVTGLARMLLDDALRVDALLLDVESLPGMTEVAKLIRKAIERRAVQLRAEAAGFRVAGNDEAPRVHLHDDVPSITVPEGYTLGDGGVFEVVQFGDDLRPVRLSHRPILPSLVLADIDTGERSVELAWKERARWNRRIVPASMVQEPRAFVRLRDHGAPVANHTTRQLAKFLDAVEETNPDNIPRAWAAGRMGYMRKGELGFALGRKVIGSDKVRVELDPDGSEAQIAAALRPQGDEGRWREAVGWCAPFPRVMLALYASVAPALLEALPTAPNAIIDWSGETSHGKTTALRVAASVWGNPDERAMGLVQKWNQTPTYLERIAAFCSHIPLMLDDTKDVPVRNRDMIPRLIYQVAGGKGKGRGKPDGTRRIESWRTCLLSTGEAALTSFSQDGGARARALVLHGPPFSDGDRERLVSDITIAVCDHFGHLGPRVVQHMLARRDDWAAMSERYEQRVAHYAAMSNSPATQRLGRIVALLEAAKEVAEACGLPTPESDPIGHAWAMAERCGDDTDRPLAALRAVHGWAVAHQSEFWGRHVVDREQVPRQPPRGWAGAWSRDGALGKWDRLAFNPDCLDRVLLHHGFEPAAVVPLWHERGWLKATEGRRTCRPRIDGEYTRCIALSREVIDAECS